MPDQWNALLKGSKITPEDAAKNPQAVLEALEFYTEQTRLDNKSEWKNDNLISSKSTPAPSHIRQPPPKPNSSKKVSPDPFSNGIVVEVTINKHVLGPY